MKTCLLHYRILLSFILSILFQNCGTYLYLEELNNQSKTYNSLVIDMFTITNASLIHYWPLDGDAEDKVGGLHLIASGGPVLTSDRHGLAGGAYYYPGDGQSYHASSAVGDQILAGDTSSFTVSAWVRGSFLQGSSGSTEIFIAQAGGYGMQYYSNSSAACTNAIRVFTNNGGTGDADLATSCTYGKDDAWYNVVFIWDMPHLTAQLFVNGILMKTVNPSTVSTIGSFRPWAVGGSFYIGFSDLSGALFQGSVDEVRIYNRIIAPNPFFGW
ncbi:LamG domain-containing protein [Leptospira semungkisensis]|uniref:LamG domain-containing protein n=1 Tax=Leptospira semungkisensis TaxID=2484985 RepID=A0A4R9G5V7_9LEPT|nr:LamG domain-containing protein [Leptospira semungkisensis]TGK06761.1 LamG domain-containing protein [Leptospira semungkisensis]